LKSIEGDQLCVPHWNKSSNSELRGKKFGRIPWIKQLSVKNAGNEWSRLLPLLAVPTCNVSVATTRSEMGWKSAYRPWAANRARTRLNHSALRGPKLGPDGVEQITLYAIATSIGMVGGLFQSGSKFGANESGANFILIFISE
jgi:hypothetical protein